MMQQTPLFLFHATTGERAKRILSSGRFEAQEQLFEESQSDYNYFYVAEELCGTIHYQSLITALVSDSMDVWLFKIPVESVKGEKVYKENFTTHHSRKTFGVSEANWETLMEDEIFEEILLKTFSFDVDAISLFQLNWNSEYVTNQFLNTLNNQSNEWMHSLQTYRRLPYFIDHLEEAIEEYNEGLGDVTTDFFRRMVSNIVVTVKFDNETVVSDIFTELFHALSELEWFTLMHNVLFMLTEDVLPDRVEEWSDAHDSYEKGYIEHDVQKVLTTV